MRARKQRGGMNFGGMVDPDPGAHKMERLDTIFLWYIDHLCISVSLHIWACVILN